MLCYMSNPCVLLTSDEDYRSRVCHFHHDVIRPQVGEKHPTPSGKIFFSESIPWNSIICRKIRREGEEDIFCVSVARSLVGKERTKRRRRGSRIYYTVGYYPPTHTHTPKTLWPSLGPTGRQVPLLFVLIPFPLCREVVQPSRHHDRTNGREKEKIIIIKKKHM
jgi:hypothetical protein